MREGYRIIDADRHVLEPLAIWRDFLEPAYRDRAPYSAPAEWTELMAERIKRLGKDALVPLPSRVLVDGEPIYREPLERTRIELALASLRRHGDADQASEPESQLRAMDQEGIDVAFLFPTLGLFLAGIDEFEPALARAFARAYNNWLIEFCACNTERLRGAGLIPCHDPAWMVTEVERMAASGFGLVVVRPNPIGGRQLSNPAYEPFWNTCERLSIAVALHEGTHARSPSAGADRFTTRFALHACSHPMEQMMALLSLIEGGVLQRHPRLRVAFLEAGCGWLPYWLWRLDEEYRNLAGEVAENVQMKPSAYFRRQCFATVEPSEPNLAEVIRYVGEGSLLFGTDFPHLDHEAGIVAQAVAMEERLSETSLRKILWENSARLYGMTL